MDKDQTNSSDIAGKAFWDGQWADEGSLPDLLNVDSTHFRNTPERKLYRLMQEVFEKHIGPVSDKALVEVGCARSEILPLFAIKSGFMVYGIDYSPVGCQRARDILKRENVNGEVACCDVLLPPETFVGRFDAVVSFGLVEHFTDTREIVTAMARLLKPGGVLITNIPNMNGITGWLQHFFNRSLFALHVPLTVAELRHAHEESGLCVVSCDYFLSNNFGVPNLGDLPRSSAEWKFKRYLLTWLTRVSKSIWWLEQFVGELPQTRCFSPYINCVAIKQKLDEHTVSRIGY